MQYFIVGVRIGVWLYLMRLVLNGPDNCNLFDLAITGALIATFIQISFRILLR